MLTEDNKLPKCSPTLPILILADRLCSVVQRFNHPETNNFLKTWPEARTQIKPTAFPVVEVGRFLDWEPRETEYIRKEPK
jgi:hypothetical protein